jgi:hypothetical protein
MPFISDEYHGRPVVMVLLAHFGDLEKGEQTVDRLRRIALVVGNRQPQVGDATRDGDPTRGF